MGDDEAVPCCCRCGGALVGRGGGDLVRAFVDGALYMSTGDVGVCVVVGGRGCRGFGAGDSKIGVPMRGCISSCCE